MTSRILLRSLLFALLALTFTGALPALADSSHARIVRLSIVQGDVRFAREVKGDPLASDKAVWEGAVSNLPIRQGYVLATDKGRAEVEFESGAMAFLAENTVLEFYDLSLNDSGTTTRLVLRQGTASFYVNPSSADYFSVTGGDFTVEAEGRSTFRVDNFDDGSVVNVSKGRVSVLHKEQTTILSKDQSLSIKAGDESSVSVGRIPEQKDEFDQWVSGQVDSVSKATAATMQYTSSSYYAAGFGSLYSYGAWFDCGGSGYGWRPFGAGLGWSPFTNGQWISDPVFGSTWISFQPWGWAPYHYGGWLFDAGCGGWFYSPPIGYVFSPGVPRKRFPIIHPPRPIYHPVTAVFVRGKGTLGGNLGFVPMHPLDAKGKTPRNLEHGVLSASGSSGQRLIPSDAGQKWQALKSAPKDAFSGSLASAAPPVHVSRSLESSTAARGVSLGKGSSITYDTTEHRFVNSNSAPVSPTKAAGEKTETSSGSSTVERNALPKPGSAQAATTATGVPRASTSVPTRAVAPPASSRAVAPPRTMTPPPAPRAGERGGSFPSGSGRYEPSSRGGGDASSRTQSAPHASAPAPAPHPSAPAPSGGRPH